MRRLNPTTPARLSSIADALAAGDAGQAAPSANAAPAIADVDRREREREALLADARREGLARGLAEAEAEVAKRTAAIAAKLEAEHARALAALKDQEAGVRKLAAALADAVVAHRREAEEAAVEAAYAALVRVLGDKAAERTLVAELCAQVLHQRGPGPVTLRLAPADSALVEPVDDVRVLPDPALAPGQCVLESARGGSDTGLDVRLEAIRVAFLEALATHRGQA